MKKTLSYLLLLALIFSLLMPTAAFAAKDKTSETETETEAETELVPTIKDTDVVSTDDIILYSSACCVMDTDTGQVLYYKNPHDEHYPASITKVMTGLLLCENYSSLKDKITFTNDCWEGIDYWTDMNIGMQDGEKLNINAALHAMLLASANEVCNGVAIYVSGSIDAFADLMNEKAASLGCTNTHFTNPNGLQDEDHYTSAYDMCLISQAAIRNETFKNVTGDTSYTVKKTNKRKEGFTLYHKHKMLMWTQYHYDGCIGGKTGYTPDAGNTLVTYAEKNGHTLVCVTLQNTDGHIYPDTIEALDYCFDNYDELAASMPESIAETEAVAETETAAPETDEAITVESSEPETEEAQTGKQISVSSILNFIRSYDSPKALVKAVFNRAVLKAGNLINAYMPYSIPVLIVGFVVLTLLLFWLFGILRRRHHRRKYRKLHKKRLKNEARRRTPDDDQDE